MALDVECPKCLHKMQVTESTVGQHFYCAQCKTKLICLVGGAVAEADVDDLKLQPIDPSAQLNNRREIKARGKSSRPAWQMPAQKKGKMKRLF
jgi:transposase-like protein